MYVAEVALPRALTSPSTLPSASKVKVDEGLGVPSDRRRGDRLAQGGEVVADGGGRGPVASVRPRDAGRR